MEYYDFRELTETPLDKGSESFSSAVSGSKHLFMFRRCSHMTWGGFLLTSIAAYILVCGKMAAKALEVSTCKLKVVEA